jgi:dTDP-4-amino-4,6-dideoxygalactose transaminase
VTRPIPISTLSLTPEDEARVLAVLRSGHLAQGPVVTELEAEFARVCGVREAVAVSSGTAALEVTLRALGVGAGDEVITSPFTFVATLNAILAVGATARFADIDPTTYTIDPEAVASLVNDRTAAVLPVHLYGLPADLERLVPLARRHGLALVEDAAQAHGARVRDRPVGSFGIGCFSLYATKNVAAGEGGIVTTDDPALADRVRLLRNQGMRERYRYEVIGTNLRLTDLAAAVAVGQVRRLGELTAARRANAERLRVGLEGLQGLRPPTEPPGRSHVYHQFTVRVARSGGRDRDRLAAALAQRRIATGVYYPRVVFGYECYEGHPGVVPEEVPEARAAAAEVLSLPVHPALRPDDLDRIVDATAGALAG